MQSVHGDLLAMSWKTGCPFALTLYTRGLSSELCEGRYVSRVGMCRGQVGGEDSYSGEGLGANL